MKFPIGYSEVTQLYSQTIEKQMHVMAVVSVDMQTGASTLCQTLAERCAQSGHKTLLVDFNFAAPHLHLAFDLEPSDWFPSQSAPFPVQKTDIDNLSVLPIPSDSARQWEFRELRNLKICIEAFREDFDVVIIDTSPLTSRNQGNVPPETICKCVDGALLNVLTGRNSETQIRDAVDLLRSAGVRIHGAVLNDRFAPGLLPELVREVRRLKRFFPNISKRLQRVLHNSTLLNQDI